MSTDFTPNYNLDKYTATDKPNLRDQYNAAMDKIDLALLSANTNATEAKATTQSFAGDIAAKADQTDLDALTQTVNGKASQTGLNALSALLPSADFSAQNTVKAALNAKANNTALNNEVTARQNADGNLQTSINNLTSRVSTLENSKYMVVIGDSFSDPSDGSAVARMWPKIVADALGLELKNFAKGGSGFCLGGENIFSQQLVNATNQIADHSRVEKVFIFGGVNDVGNITVTADNVKNAATSLIISASETFPNAEIVVAGICPTRNADRHGNANSPFDVSVTLRHRSDIFTEYLGIACVAANENARIKNAVKFISLRNFSYLIDGFYQSNENWHPTLRGHMAIASKFLGGNTVHDTANISGGRVFTAKPTFIDGDGVSHEASDIEVSIIGSNLAQVSGQIYTPTTSGTAQRYIQLNGYPSGPAYLTIFGANTGKTWVCAGQGSSNGRCIYTVPNSYDDARFRFLYTFGV